MHMAKHVDSLSNNPTPNHRKHAPKGVALLMAGLLLAACNTDSAPDVTFKSYDQAQAKIEQLAKKHGETADVPGAVSTEIKRSLQAAVPYLTEKLSGNFNQLLETLRDRTGFKDMATFVSKDGVHYDFNSWIDDEGNKVDSISVSEAYNGTDLKTSTKTDLYATHLKDGGLEVSYYLDNEFTKGDDREWHNERFNIGGKSISYGGGFGTASIKKNTNDVQSAWDIEFNGKNFGPLANDGPDLSRVMEGFGEANKVISDALHVVTTSPNLNQQ